MQTGKTLNESWRPIAGYEGCYEVSDQGQVRSVPRVIMRSNGRPKTVTARILKTARHRAGYRFVYLCRAGERRACYLVHRLVAAAFIPNPQNLPEVNHLNGNKADNRAGVLEWVTPQDNWQHAVAAGLCPHRLKPCPVRCLNNGAVYPSQIAAARALGLRTNRISEVVRGARKQIMGYRFEKVPG
jgi:hypothetical protein